MGGGRQEGKGTTGSSNKETIKVSREGAKPITPQKVRGEGTVFNMQFMFLWPPVKLLVLGQEGEIHRREDVTVLEKGGVMILEKGGVTVLEKGGVMILEKRGVMILEKGGVTVLEKGGVMILEKGEEKDGGVDPVKEQGRGVLGVDLRSGGVTRGSGGREYPDHETGMPTKHSLCEYYRIIALF